MEVRKKYDLEDRLIEFAVSATEIVEILPNTRTGNHMAGQLVRSCTSPALNYGEAQAAESRSDFIHKMKISLKELRETYVNLKFISRKSLVKNELFLQKTLKENDELISIFIRSISTAQENLKKESQKPK
jgi:four helix bundle protein